MFNQVKLHRIVICGGMEQIRNTKTNQILNTIDDISFIITDDTFNDINKLKEYLNYYQEKYQDCVYDISLINVWQKIRKDFSNIYIAYLTNSDITSHMHGFILRFYKCMSDKYMIYYSELLRT